MSNFDFLRLDANSLIVAVISIIGTLIVSEIFHKKQISHQKKTEKKDMAKDIMGSIEGAENTILFKWKLYRDNAEYDPTNSTPKNKTKEEYENEIREKIGEFGQIKSEASLTATEGIKDQLDLISLILNDLNYEHSQLLISPVGNFSFSKSKSVVELREQKRNLSDLLKVWINE